MLIVKYKRVEATDSNFTQDQIYTALTLDSAGATFLDDNNLVRPQAMTGLNNPSFWELVSIHQQQLVHIYP